MTKHALERIKERYGKELSIDDLNLIRAAIKKERFVYLEKKIIEERYTILLKYDNIPLKLVCCKNQIITALPFDIEATNKYLKYLPEIKHTLCLDKNSNEKKELEANFKSLFPKEMSVCRSLNFMSACEQNINLNVEHASPYYVIIWYYTGLENISYSIYAINSLKRKIRNNLLILIEENEFKTAKYLLDLGAKINDL